MNKYLEFFRMNIKYNREQAGISRIYLSILCDCGTGTIRGIESGKANPSFDMMGRLAEALKVNPTNFFIKDASRSKAELKLTLNFLSQPTEFTEKTSQPLILR